MVFNVFLFVCVLTVSVDLIASSMSVLVGSYECVSACLGSCLHADLCVS